jgi:hypothetical protein
MCTCGTVCPAAGPSCNTPHKLIYPRFMGALSSSRSSRHTSSCHTAGQHQLLMKPWHRTSLEAFAL